MTDQQYKENLVRIEKMRLDLEKQNSRHLERIGDILQRMLKRQLEAEKETSDEPDRD